MRREPLQPDDQGPPEHPGMFEGVMLFPDAALWFAWARGEREHPPLIPPPLIGDRGPIDTIPPPSPN